MITANSTDYQPLASNWQTELAAAITNPEQLLKLLDLDPLLLQNNQQAMQQFVMRVPRGFAKRMRKGNPQDPLLLQVLPLHHESNIVPGFSRDPLQEAHNNPVPGLLHKYRDRVLLTLTSGCAVHCRYCFRRHFPYEKNTPGMEGWKHALIYIQQNSNIKEIIFSGGDPLVVKDPLLHELIQQIAAIPHIKRLRIHSRLPIVLPERITDELITALTSTRLKPIMVVHANHANEIDHTVKTAIANLHHAGITVLNQSVLLKGINDSVEALINLSETLFDIGILPYYLHLLDKVQGAAHFEVEEGIAKQLMKQMMQQLPGYLVPKLVREQSGASSKIPVAIF